MVVENEDKTQVKIKPDEDKAARPPRKRYTLDELMDRCDPSIPMSKEELEWESMKPVGREIF